VAILAGELEGGWKIEWRRWLFFALVRIHARRRLVPAISFAENGTNGAMACGSEHGAVPLLEKAMVAGRPEKEKAVS
jgi:hypothetical protein